MAISAKYEDTEFSVGDLVRVTTQVQEGEKTRSQIFEGMVISIKGHGDGKSFVVRRIGAARVGIERIFPFISPSVKDVELVRKGKRGVRRAKLYYTREKSGREIEKIYSRSTRREEAKVEGKKRTRKATKKKATKKTSKKK